jgi:hypothetical protein
VFDTALSACPVTPGVMLCDAVSCCAVLCRNGGHERLLGLQDHHLLHYKVTLACAVHVANITWRALTAAPHLRVQ